MDYDCKRFGQFPRAGAWHDQNDFEMEAMRVARSAEIVYLKKKNGDKLNISDAEFLAWIESDE